MKLYALFVASFESDGFDEMLEAIDHPTESPESIAQKAMGMAENDIDGANFGFYTFHAENDEQAAIKYQAMLFDNGWEKENTVSRYWEISEAPTLETSPIVVLNDGETFSGIDGAAIAMVPDAWDTNTTEERLRDGSTYLYNIGPSSQPPPSADDAITLLKALCPWLTVEYDNDGQVVFYSGVFDETKSQ